MCKAARGAAESRILTEGGAFVNTVKRGNLYMLCLFCFNLAAQFSFGVYAALTENWTLFDSPYFYIYSQALLFGVPFLAYALMNRREIAEILPVARPETGVMLLVIAMCACLCPAMMLMSAFTSIFFDNAAAGVFEDLSGQGLLFTVVSICVAPAVFEEINFRGIILTNYKNAKGAVAVAVNGLFFGLIHLNSQQFLYAFVLGVVFAAIVRRSQNILYSVAAHFFLNATQVLLDYAFETEPAINDAQPALGEYAWLAVMSLIGAAAFAALYRAFAKRCTLREE